MGNVLTVHDDDDGVYKNFWGVARRVGECLSRADSNDDGVDVDGAQKVELGAFL